MNPLHIAAAAIAAAVLVTGCGNSPATDNENTSTPDLISGSGGGGEMPPPYQPDSLIRGGSGSGGEMPPEFNPDSLISGGSGTGGNVGNLPPVLGSGSDGGTGGVVITGDTTGTAMVSLVEPGGPATGNGGSGGYVRNT